MQQNQEQFSTTHKILKLSKNTESQSRSNKRYQSFPSNNW